jgi:hypothetical protein
MNMIFVVVTTVTVKITVSWDVVPCSLVAGANVHMKCSHLITKLYGIVSQQALILKRIHASLWIRKTN